MAAMTDPSAPLVSVSCFLNRVDVALQRRARTGMGMAVIVVGVAETSDVRGPASGPAAKELALAVAGWVLAAPGPADSAVLTDGGEFAILCGGIRESGETDIIVRRIGDAMAQRFEVGGEPVSVVTATGVAMASCPEDTAEVLIASAGRAMRVARPWDPAGPAVPVHGGPALGVSLAPDRAAGGDAGNQAAAGHAARAPALSAGMELAEAMIDRLFGVGVLLQAAVEQADGVVAEGIRQAVNELDAIIRDERTAAFGVQFSPGTGDRATPC